MNLSDIGSEVSLGYFMTYVSESIPLCSTLRVHCVCVVICNALKKRFDVMLEHLAVEGWCFWHRKRKTEYLEHEYTVRLNLNKDTLTPIVSFHQFRFQQQKP